MQPGMVTRSQSGAEGTGAESRSDKSAGTSSGKNPPKEFRVAALVKNNAQAKGRHNPAAQASGINNPPAVITDHPEFGAPRQDAGRMVSLDQDQVQEIVRVEATPIAFRIVTQTLGEELPATQVAIREDITAAVTDLWNEIPQMIEEKLKAARVVWEQEMQKNISKLEQEHSSSRSRLLSKIDTLDGEVTMLKAEVNDLQSAQAAGNQGRTQVPGDHKLTRSKKKSSKSKFKKAETSEEEKSSSGSDHGGDSSDSSDSSSSSRSYGKKDKRKKTFAERNPRNQRFRKVLSYKKYRLEKRSTKRSGSVRKRVSTWTKRMSTSVAKFSGKDPISVLKFLATFKIAADNNGIPEGGACLVLRNFLEGRALVAFDASLQVDAVTTDAVGIKTWPDAVHWMLTTYAKDIYIQKAVQEIRALRQLDNETEYDFGHRVLTLFSRILGVYKQEDQIMAFIDGLPDIVSAGVIRDRNTNPECYETLQAVLELADSHGVAERARKPLRPMVKRAPFRASRRALFVGEQPSTVPSSSTGRTSTTSADQTREPVLAVEEDHAEHFSFPTTPTTYSYEPTEDSRNYVSHQTIEDVTEEDSYQTAATALPIVSNHNPRLERYAQPNRPGWIDRQHTPQILQRRPLYRNVETDPDHRSCFLCANATHYVMDCPMISDSMRNEARRNLAEATPQQRKHLPRWTFALAGIPYPQATVPQRSQNPTTATATPQPSGNNVRETQEKGQGA